MNAIKEVPRCGKHSNLKTFNYYLSTTREFPEMITNRQIEQATWKSAEDALFNLAKYLKAQGDDYVSSIILNIRNEVITQHYSRKNRTTN